MDWRKQSSNAGGAELPESDDETMDKMACIEAMLNRMEHTPNASDVLLQRILGLVNKEDLSKMVQLQTHMLSRYEKTNEMLVNFNALSLARYETTCNEFKRHTQLLTTMKGDLDDVFLRIRALKRTLSSQYPEAFKVCEVKHELPEEEEEEEITGDNTTPNTQSFPQQSGPSFDNVASSQPSAAHTQTSSQTASSTVVRPRANTAEIIDGED